MSARGSRSRCFAFRLRSGNERPFREARDGRKHRRRDCQSSSDFRIRHAPMFSTESGGTMESACCAVIGQAPGIVGRATVVSGGLSYLRARRRAREHIYK